MKIPKVKPLTIIFLSAGVGFVLIAILFVTQYYQPESYPVVIKPMKTHTYAYNIHIDSLDVSYGVVKNHQNLSSILSSHIPAALIDKIARETSDVFDIRKIHTGQRYAFITAKDSIPRLDYFIYEINPIDFVVYDFRDSLRVYRDKKKVVTEVRTAKGIISTSLWNTMEENHLDVDLILRMSDVYAWTIDFYGLQKGDDFRVMYEQILVDSIPVSSDRIIAALFRSGNRNFYAFYFEQDNDKGYFDVSGQSLRRSFLKAPFAFLQDQFPLFPCKDASYPPHCSSTFWCGLFCAKGNSCGRPGAMAGYQRLVGKEDMAVTSAFVTTQYIPAVMPICRDMQRVLKPDLP